MPLIFFCLTVAFPQENLLSLDDIFSPDAAKRVKFGGTLVFAQWEVDGQSFKQVMLSASIPFPV
jgi:hypothetical protein